MLDWFEKKIRDFDEIYPSTESQLAKMTGVDEMLIHAVRYSEEKLQSIFKRAEKNEKIDTGGKVSLGGSLLLLAYGAAKSGTFGLVGGVASTALSLVPVFMAYAGQKKIATEIKQAGLDRLMSDYKVQHGIAETVTLDTMKTGGQPHNKMTVT